MKYSIIIIFILLQFSTMTFAQQNGKQAAWYSFSEIMEKPVNSDFAIAELVLNVYQNTTKTLSCELINYQDQKEIILTQDRSLVMIAEAFYNEKWIPIQYWIWSTCGNSYMRPLLLKKGQYVEVELPDFGKDFSTSVRLKICTGKEYLYSNTFESYISKDLLEEKRFSSDTEFPSSDTFLDNCNVEPITETMSPEEIMDLPIKKN